MMQKDINVIIISTLAMYQTKFWDRIGEELIKENFRVIFISFDDVSTDYLKSKGKEVFSPLTNFQESNSYEMDKSKLEDELSVLNYASLNTILSHEKITNKIKSNQQIHQKMMLCQSAIGDVFDNLAPEDKPIVIQELGGFVSVLSCYLEARKRSIEHLFVEPSFFKSRQFFLRNTLAAEHIEPMKTMENFDNEYETYIEEMLQNKAIVIPDKDRHHYTSVWSKVLNLKNFIRLIEKLFDKYVKRKKQEFGHIWVYVRKHLLMVWNASRLSLIYKTNLNSHKIIYFPLHVPGDVALTLRAPEYVDQLYLVEYLLRHIPYGYKLCIKEHPAMRGEVDVGRIKRLVKLYDNLYILNPKINNYDVLEKCKAVISINSKSGAEGAILGKPVLLLGNAFYETCPTIIPIKSVTEIAPALLDTLRVFKPQEEQVLNFFNEVWKKSYKGELYSLKYDNIHNFKSSILLNVNKLNNG